MKFRGLRIFLLAVAVCSCLQTSSCSLHFGTSDQCVSVVGRLYCPGNPAKIRQVLVNLRDTDEGPDPDDAMDNGYTSDNGNFHLHGCAHDLIGDIDPVLTVKHNCKGQKQKIEITVDQRFIWGVYNVTINLESSNPQWKTENFDGEIRPLCGTGKR